MKYVCEMGDVESVLALKIISIPFVHLKEVFYEATADDDGRIRESLGESKIGFQLFLI